jgi:dihydrofolate reductase
MMKFDLKQLTLWKDRGAVGQCGLLQSRCDLSTVGGGPTVVHDFLAAGLIDHLHVVVVPILLGRGVRLWDRLEGLEKDYKIEAISSPSGVTHMTFTRAGA